MNQPKMKTESKMKRPVGRFEGVVRGVGKRLPKGVRRILVPALVLSSFAATVPGSMFAGQSLVLTSATVNVNDPFYPVGHSWRVEFQMHSWTFPPAGSAPPAVIYLAGTGAAAYLAPGGTIALAAVGDRVVEQQPCQVSTAGATNALVRFQRNVSTMQITCELWNFDGTAYNTQTLHISSLGNLPFNGGFLGGSSIASASLGFLRVSTTTLPLGGRPPVTADTGDWTDLRFDGNLVDSSGKGHGGTGQYTYVATPNQVPIAFPKTAGAPFWTNWTSLRAGFPNQLDSTASYTLADGSSSVSSWWQQTAGPSTVRWLNRNTATPTITGLVFGGYTFQLQVTDSAGGVATAGLTLGAVATDSNGVVVQANPAADAIFGPMIAFGRNPWSYADERNLRMENLQQNTYATPPAWSSPAESATVSYTYFDPITAAAGATLAGSITATTLTIPVSSVAGLDLSTLPTQILVGTAAAWEVIRICSAAGNSLNVCYDGRAFHYGYDTSYTRPATPWGVGTKVWQAKVKGTNTHFLSTICSNGPGWQVGAKTPQSSGSISVVPGSATATGVGTNWQGTGGSNAIAISATHGGTPFVFYTYIVAANGTAMTFARPFPSDADQGTYSYVEFNDGRNIVLHYTRSDSTDGYVYFGTIGCETDTDLYLYTGWDNAYHDQKVSASPYTYMDGFGYVGDFSPNFYDMGLAHYAFYFRSGLKQSLTSARNMEDYWMRYPENAQGDAGGAPRDRSILGVLAAAVLDGDRASNWSGLRTYALAGLGEANLNNCDDDLRETAYQLSWLAMAAEFDPNPAQRAIWQSDLANQSYNRDSGCKRADNSFAAGNYWAAQPTQIALTQGSQTGTAVNGTFPSNMCYSAAHGTALATNGSALLTSIGGSFVPPAGANQLLVGGTIGGARYDLAAQYDYNFANGLTMSALWPGDSGTVYWSIENNTNLNYVLTISQGQNDTANFGQIDSCTLIDSTHIQLYRPWPGASGTYSYFYYNLVGRGTQTFMAGIKTLQMRFAGQVYAPYQSLDQAIANWVATTGFDPATKGVFYGRVFPMCEPALVDSGISDVQYRTLGCIENSFNLSATTEARARNSEAQNAMTVMYLANPTATNRAIGDMFYGATYGAQGYTASGYWTDGITASNLDDVSLGSYKWPGFFFGIGMAHQWPAARLGGVAPPQYRTVYIGFNASAAASAKIVLTAPSGATSTFPCGSTSPCAVTVDDRQGAHWFQIQYLSPSGQVVASSDPDLLAGPQQ